MLEQYYQDCLPADVGDTPSPSNDDQQQACLEAALNSDNPTIVDALQSLFVLVRLVEPDGYRDCVEQRNVYSIIAECHAQRINAGEAHAMIDTVLASRDCAAVFALDNFMDVARPHARRRSARRSGASPGGAHCGARYQTHPWPQRI
jgi:hypothetical protein